MKTPLDSAKALHAIRVKLDDLAREIAAEMPALDQSVRYGDKSELIAKSMADVRADIQRALSGLNHVIGTARRIS